MDIYCHCREMVTIKGVIILQFNCIFELQEIKVLLGKLFSFIFFFFQVYGLDINPRAVKISWINLYLNALDDNGEPIYDDEKKTLLDRIEFHESDLLAYCKDNRIELERIVGCIPQVLLQLSCHVIVIYTIAIFSL